MKNEKPEEYEGVREFVRQREKELEKALGVWTDEDTWVFALGHLREHFYGDFTGWHDNHSRYRQSVLRDYLSGIDVKPEDLRAAIYELSASHQAACESNWCLKKALEQIRRHPPRPGGLIPPRRALG